MYEGRVVDSVLDVATGQRTSSLRHAGTGKILACMAGLFAATGHEVMSDGKRRQVFVLSLDQLRGLVRQPSWCSVQSRALECLAFARDVQRTKSYGFVSTDRVVVHDLYVLRHAPEPGTATTNEAAMAAATSKAIPCAVSAAAVPPLPADVVSTETESPVPPPKKARSVPLVPDRSEAAPAKQPPSQPVRAPSSWPYRDIVPPPPPVVKAQAPAVMPPPLAPAQRRMLAASSANSTDEAPIAKTSRPRGNRGGQRKMFYAQLYAGCRRDKGPG